MAVIIGKDKKGVTLKLDLQRLIESRMLIQASSGGGKSYILRVLAEQILPYMPVIILDWEGEFASLREKFDLVLVGPSGEIPCNIKSAALVARSLITLRVSAVIDMSELKTHQRQEYTKRFLDELINDLPKKLWPSMNGRAVMVMVDEAHKLCPQREKSMSSSAVIDLQSLGRKRGLCGVVATQRLSKLNKDAAAECNNILVGRCSSIDSGRACEELGLPPSNRHGLTQLATGEWKAVGPAFKPGLQEFKCSKAKTTHEKSGVKLLKPPAPSAKIKKILPQLQAIQNKTVQEVKDLADAKKELANIRRQLTLAEKKQKTEIREVEKVVVDQRAINRAIKERDRDWNKRLGIAMSTVKKLEGIVKKVRDTVDTPQARGTVEVEAPAPPKPTLTKPKPRTGYVIPEGGPIPPRKRLTPVLTENELSGGQQRIVDSIAWWNNIGSDRPDKTVVAVMAGYKVSGNYNNLLGGLRTLGYVEYPVGGCVSLTDAGVELANHPDAPGTLADLHNAWHDKLSPAQRKLLDIVIENYPDEITKEELAEQSGYQVSGNFNNLLGNLRSYGVIVKRGPIKATELLFPEDLA